MKTKVKSKHKAAKVAYQGTVHHYLSQRGDLFVGYIKTKTRIYFVAQHDNFKELVEHVKYKISKFLLKRDKITEYNLVPFTKGEEIWSTKRRKKVDTKQYDKLYAAWKNQIGNLNLLKRELGKETPGAYTVTISILRKLAAPESRKILSKARSVWEFRGLIEDRVKSLAKNIPKSHQKHIKNTLDNIRKSIYEHTQVSNN